jgi:formyltetrahydrofolate-dependent phosphoribosylglycinamide formyltransferase
MHPVFDDGRPLRLAVLISGAGTNLANLIEHIRDRRLRGVRITAVVSSRSQVRGVAIASAAGLPVRVIRRRDHSDDTAFSDAITQVVAAAEADLVVMAGFLCFWRIPPRFRNRVLNIHPSLLPKYGGKGMFGKAVHEAVLAAGERESGCTVHIADNEYDHGPVVDQRRLTIEPGETVDTLSRRVAELERELYPAVLARVQERGLEWLDEIARMQNTGDRV